MMCCVCLEENTQIMNIFDDLGIKLNVAEIINKYLCFKPLLNCSLTSKICMECWYKIYDFHKFYVTVENAHKDFNRKVEDELTTSIIKQENNEDVFDDNLMQIEFEMDKVSQNVEMLLPVLKKSLDDDCEIEKSYKNDSEDHSEEYESSNATNQDFEENNFKKTLKNSSKKKNSAASKAPKDIQKSKKKRVSRRLDPKLTDEIIKKHIQMACNLCIYVGKTFCDIIEHFKCHHENTKPYIMCCGKKFTRGCYIAQHAYIHENPNFFSCSECNKSFTTGYGLHIHNISYHASEEEQTYVCEQCPRKFARRQLLELHKQAHIPKEEWAIVCNKCTTRTAKFATQYLLNKHTLMYHRRETNICQVCAKEIRDKKSFDKHVRSHYEDSGPRLKCYIENCERWLKDEENLKIHIQRYHLDDKTYKCPDCDKLCSNRRSLASHKHYFHSREVFRCEKCDKKFKTPLTLKEHMTQHTGEALYTCPFCTRTFKSSANMHSHKKKQHPVEWEELRSKKQGPLP